MLYLFVLEQVFSPRHLMARELPLPFRALEEVVIMACGRWVT